jgi:hypothetical protein
MGVRDGAPQRSVRALHARRRVNSSGQPCHAPDAVALEASLRKIALIAPVLPSLPILLHVFSWGFEPLT